MGRGQRDQGRVQGMGMGRVQRDQGRLMIGGQRKLEEVQLYQLEVV